MPVQFRFGDMMTESQADFYCVAVNCDGVAGAGQAKQWASMDKMAHEEYRALCRDKSLRGGDTIYIYPHWVLCATKVGWRYPSQIQWVSRILHTIAKRKIREWPDQLGNVLIALPWLGCGLGGLDKGAVAHLIKAHLGNSSAMYEVWDHAR